MLMPFGKYRGRHILEICALDRGYLEWAAPKIKSRHIRAYAFQVLNGQRTERPVHKQPSGGLKFEKAEIMWLIKRSHPDVNNDDPLAASITRKLLEARKDA